MKGLDKSPYKDKEKSIDYQEITTILTLKDSGRALYLFLLENRDKFLAHDGIVYINPIELMNFMNVSRKTIYNGVNSLIQADVLKRSNEVGEYFYNYDFFPKW